MAYKNLEVRRAHYKINKSKILLKNKEWRRKNKHKLKYDWHKKNKSRVAENSRISKYKISRGSYAAGVERQRGLCLLCGVKPKTQLVVDHDHVTDKVRGLICYRCNVGLGSFLDSEKLLQRAIVYLQENG